MQFHLLLSNTYQNAFSQVLQKLKLQSEMSPQTQHFLVVPDRVTLNAEKRLFEHLNIQSTFSVEVITLSKLANKVLKNTLNAKKVLTKQSGIMLTTKVVLNNKQHLKAFSRATHFTGFIENVYETIMQLKSCNITPEEFLNSAPKDNVSLQLKMQDIALIYKNYQTELEKGYLDASTKLSLFAEAISTNETIQNAHFYFALFDSFTPQQYYILSKLVKHSSSVNIGLCSNTKQNNAHIYTSDMYEQLVSIAKQYGMRAKDIITNQTDKLNPAFAHILTQFEAYKPSIYLLEPNNKNLMLFEAKSIKEEVEFVASSILLKVQNGERFCNLQIATSNMTTYASIIKEVFSRYHIPYYLDQSEVLTNHHFVGFLLQAIKTAKSNLLNTEVLSYTKNYFTGFSLEEQNLFEDAVLKLGTNYNQFYNNCFEKENENTMLEKVRSTVVSDLAFFDKKQAKVAYFVQQAFAFLTHKNATEKLSELMKNYEKTNQIVEQKRTSQVYEKLHKILLELEELLGEEEVSLTEFYELLLQVVSATTLSTIPVSVDAVFVGEASNNNFMRKNVLFVLGAVEEELPNLKADVGIILEDELKKINKLVTLEPSIHQLNKRTKFNLFQLLLTPKKQLVVSYARSDEKQKEQKPAQLIKTLQRLFYVKETGRNIPLPVHTMETLLQNDVTQTSWMPYYYANEKVAVNKWLNKVVEQKQQNEQISEPLNSLYELLLKTRSSQTLLNYLNNAKPTTEFERISNAYALFFEKERTKVSQLESYFTCPFKHFLEYGLKLKEKERAGMRPLDVGIILHKVAEQFGNKLKQNKISFPLNKMANGFIDAILKEPQYAQFLKNREYQNMILSLKEEATRLVEAIYHEQQNSAFRLSELEFSFGLMGNNALEVKVGDKTISFAGVVDRIDLFENYFRIIDYKTGKSNFSFKELYFGKKIQLFLYASVYRMITNKKLAGVFYFPIKNEFEDENTNNTLYKMEGALLDNLAVVKAFDKNLSAAQPKSSIVYVTIKTDAQDNITVLDHHTQKRAFTEEEFTKIEEYLKNLIQTALEEIISGVITPSPLQESKLPCDYCAYKSTCPIFSHFEAKQREMQTIALKTITEAK
jgi:ATP-dependent helicase/nuclease subunit B